MKAISTEEKAKAYDEAIEKAKKYRDECKMRGNEWFVEDIEEMFPELKEENEDEKVRKEIIETIKNYGPQTANPKLYNAMLAWMERQRGLNPTDKGEEKSAWSKEDEDMLYKATSVINRLCAERREYVWSVNTLDKLFYWLNSLKER